MNTLQVADSFHTKKLCSRLSSSEVSAILDGTAVLRLSPFGGL